MQVLHVAWAERKGLLHAFHAPLLPLGIGAVSCRTLLLWAQAEPLISCKGQWRGGCCLHRTPLWGHGCCLWKWRGERDTVFIPGVLLWGTSQRSHTTSSWSTHGVMLHPSHAASASPGLRSASSPVDMQNVWTYTSSSFFPLQSSHF